MLEKMTRSLVVLVALAAAPAARADEVDDRAQGNALFDEGRKLMAAKDFEHACPKLAAADKLIQGIGTAVNLGECYEQSGKLASAMIQYQVANGRAKKAGETEKAKDTEERAKKLAPRVPQLVVDVPAEAKVDGLEVKKQGSVILPESWGTPFPCDPGHFELEVGAPGRRSQKVPLDVEGEGKTVHVAIPVLEKDDGKSGDGLVKPPDDSKDPTDDPKPGASSPGTAQRIAGFVIGGTGIAAGIAGFVIGGVAYGNQAEGCVSNEIGLVCPPDRIGQQKDAHALAWASTGVLIGAGVLVAAGLVIVLTAPSAKVEAKPGTTAQVRVTPTGLSVEGTFQ